MIAKTFFAALTAPAIASISGNALPMDILEMIMAMTIYNRTILAKQSYISILNLVFRLTKIPAPGLKMSVRNKYIPYDKQTAAAEKIDRLTNPFAKSS